MNGFDTSGSVTLRRDLLASGVPAEPDVLEWSDLSPFAQGYVEAMLREWLLKSGPGRRAPRGFSDLHPDTLAVILKDCEGNAAFASTQEGGRQFWMTRQRGAYAVHGGLRPLTITLDETGKVRLSAEGSA